MTSQASTLAAVDRFPSATRRNRATLSLLGLLLLAAGAAGAALGWGAWGDSNRRREVVDPAMREFAGHWWFWPSAAVLALIVALYAVSWLLVQLRSNRLDAFHLEADRRRGETTLDASALTTAVAQELSSYSGVSRASARLSGPQTAPTLNIAATLDGRRQLGAVADRVLSGPVAHAREALDLPQLDARVELRIARSRRRSVR